MGRGDRRGGARGDGGVRARGARRPASTCKRLCFTGTAEELTRTELQQPALVATSLAINAALRARGIEPDYVVGHSVGEFSALGAARSIERARGDRASCASAASRWRRPPRSGRARWPRSSASPTRSSRRLCRKIPNVWPANYNCPGQLVISGETDAVDECCDGGEREGARRAIRLKVSGAFHSPLVEHAAERLRPAIERSTSRCRRRSSSRP